MDFDIGRIRYLRISPSLQPTAKKTGQWQLEYRFTFINSQYVLDVYRRV